MNQNRIINHLVIQTFKTEDVGVFYGRMGLAITFYTLGRRLKNDIFSNFGDELLENILMSLDTTISKDFSIGLSGIGWGIEYLIHERFIECASDNILEDLDKIIVEEDWDISDLSLETGMEGLLHYILAHIKGCITRKESVPFNDIYLANLYKLIQNLPISINSNLKELKNKYTQWYLSGELFYEFDLERFIKPYTPIEPLNINPLSLSEGLAGHILLS